MLIKCIKLKKNSTCKHCVKIDACETGKLQQFYETAILPYTIHVVEWNPCYNKHSCAEVQNGKYAIKHNMVDQQVYASLHNLIPTDRDVRN